MKSYIKAIIIFNKKGEKRVVPLKQGVNIITGESKTGKSALVEIIDYCLCSTRCTIPKGKITDFSYLYTLVMAISDNTYVIARYNWEDGGKMHFSKEGKDFEPKGLELSYFAEKPALPFRDIKNEIECALGLFVTNIPTDAAPQGKKASLRNIAENDSKLIEATEWLDNELRITEKYTADFSEDVRKLKDEHSKIEEKIKEVWKQIKTIEQKFISSKALISKREKVNYAKARIALYAEMSDSGIFETVDEEIEDLKGKIASLEEKIKGFDVDKKMEKAESFLSNNMNRLSLTLDFEEEYRPIDLNFGLTDGSFDIYQHQKNNENIHLYEMGSGANWVSCHIALFLSFLRFFATQDNSPMPLFMFFDQPSQVYFPQGNDKDEITQADLMAVNKMYKTIFDEINSIGEDTERLPQIIIVDHVDGKSLKCKEEFEKYVCCNWRNNTALI